MSKDNGGPAFPVVFDDSVGAEMSVERGLTVRDYIAIHASDADVERVMLENFDHVIEIYLVTRQQARYMHADLMLEARK